MRSPSPIKAAVLAALPADGSMISRQQLIAAVQRACPDAPRATVTSAIQDVASSPRYRVERPGTGLYRRAREETR